MVAAVVRVGGVARGRLMWLVGLVLALLLAGCGSGAKNMIELSYQHPSEYDIPSKIHKIGIAEFGGSTHEDRRWGYVASDILAHVLDELNRQHARYQLVDRMRLKAILDERDLQLALSNSTDAARIGEIAEVDAMIYGRVSVSSRDEQATRVVFDFVNQTTKTVPYLRRYCTVSVNFTMDDVITGKTIASVTATRDYDSDKDVDDGTRFAQAMGLAGDEFSPKDKVTGELIQECVDEFVRKISPHMVSAKVKLRRVEPEIAQTGNKMADAGDFQEALDCYLAALEEFPDDDSIVFNAGVMYEALGYMDKAEAFYDKAFKLDAKEEYLVARKRVREESAAMGGVKVNPNARAAVVMEEDD